MVASLVKHRHVKITSQPDKYPHRRLAKLTFNQAFHVGITPRSSSEIVTLSREKNLCACIHELSAGNYRTDCTLRVSGWPIYSGCSPLFFFFSLLVRARPRLHRPFGSLFCSPLASLLLQNSWIF